MLGVLNKTVVLVLNRNWQAINIRTPADAFCQMATNVATALEIDGFEQSAMGDLLGADFGQLAERHKLYNCHDLILQYKGQLFDHRLNPISSVRDQLVSTLSHRLARPDSSSTYGSTFGAGFLTESGRRTDQLCAPYIRGNCVGRRKLSI